MVKKLIESHYPDVVAHDFAKMTPTQLENTLALKHYKLISEAEGWGIEVPRKQEWYVAETLEFGSGFKLADTKYEVEGTLNSLGKAVITKQIRDARFTYWKGWVDLLIPILALTVAIIAILKD